jgi:Asp-tRNA(Asn)/Glu-tRNA(Gln) amidotransferase A subunit family amidase
MTSNNRAVGPVCKPADQTRFPGGSPGGTVAAISAGIVAGGLGTDIAESVRVPAALCGLVGIHSTTWQVKQSGIVAAVPGFDVVGPLARNWPTQRR